MYNAPKGATSMAEDLFGNFYWDSWFLANLFVGICKSKDQVVCLNDNNVLIRIVIV